MGSCVVKEERSNRQERDHCTRGQEQNPDSCKIYREAALGWGRVCSTHMHGHTYRRRAQITTSMPGW